MKREKRGLLLTKETVRLLSTTNLGRVPGGQPAVSVNEWCLTDSTPVTQTCTCGTTFD